MPPFEARVDTFVNSLHRALRYAFYDWTRGMPKSRRFIVWLGILLQGYAVYALWTRSLIWPLIWPKGGLLYLYAWLLYFP